MNSSSNRFGATGDTPFCEVRSYKGRSLFLFAVFACFAVENITDTPFKFYEPRTTRTARTRRSRPYNLSRLDLQRTLRFTFPPSPSRTSSGLQGTLPFLFACFAPFAVKNTTVTPFEYHEPRTTRRVRTRRSRPYKLSRFSRISRLKYNGHSL